MQSGGPQQEEDAAPICVLGASACDGTAVIVCEACATGLPQGLVLSCGDADTGGVMWGGGAVPCDLQLKGGICVEGDGGGQAHCACPNGDAVDASCSPQDETDAASD
jgi:hypothetical protein